VSTTALRDDVHVIGWVGVAHALSHLFQLVMPPLFPYIKDAFELSYAQLGFAVALFYAISGCLQTVAGFAVDRCGPRVVLVFGLTMAASGALIAAAATGYPMLVLAALVGGIGNSVFHPADLALLNAKVAPNRLGYAFSVHSVGGSVGYVAAPIIAVTIAHLFDWRVALAAVGAAGLAFTALLAAQGALVTPRDRRAPAGSSAGTRADLQMLLARPVLLSFAFFLLQAFAMVGFMTFAPTAFAQLYDAPLVFATSLLTAFLVGGIAGTLAGGVLAGRTERHDTVAWLGMLASAVLTGAVATGAMPLALLWPAAFGVGAGMGLASPSRDILVRGIAPIHARGKIYGFVYSGLDAGAGVAPLVFGWLLDRGLAAGTFAIAALCLALAIPVTLGMARRI
jgi:MFS transporter, FSR family, fosmidomycin resistance protein